MGYNFCRSFTSGWSLALLVGLLITSIVVITIIISIVIVIIVTIIIVIIIVIIIIVITIIILIIAVFDVRGIINIATSLAAGSLAHDSPEVVLLGRASKPRLKGMGFRVLRV